MQKTLTIENFLNISIISNPIPYTIIYTVVEKSIGHEFMFYLVLSVHLMGLSMSCSELKLYYDRPCRFKLRSGKEVYGVIWAEHDQLFFASVEAYKIFSENDLIEDERAILTQIAREDILGAELIPAMAS